jgi:polyvinyl alcohol dehydrogenase (cytochrome)
MRKRVWALTALAVVVAGAVSAAYAAQSANWSSHGQSITDWRYQPAEKKLSANTVGGLQQAWATQMTGDISSTPAVVDGVVYVTDWGGKVSALDARTGAVIWQTDVAAASGQSGTVVSRTSPAVSGNSVVIGTQTGAMLVSLDKTTGATNWVTQLDTHPMAIVTQSPTIYNGVVYDGVASVEENGVDCEASLNACYFRGSENAVNLATGVVLWKTYTISLAQQQAGYSGAAVWGSAPAVDVKRNSLYVTTGNNYGTPPSVRACALAAGTDQAALAACEPQGNGNYVDAILSLDLTSGAIKWSNKVQGYDAWTTACIGYPTACPTPAGPDFDFGQGAMLIPTKKGDIVAAGQKSGIMWALDADTGAKVWSTLAGPGSSLGGMEWGSATDGDRIYFAISNLGGFTGPITYPMVNPPKGTPATSSAGSWGAIDAETGKIKWQVADPNGAIDIGPVSVANGVVYVGSMAGAPFSFNFNGPSMFALDAGNGKELWRYTAGGSVNAGPAIANAMLFWGSGYSNLTAALGGANGKLYAFKLP